VLQSPATYALGDWEHAGKKTFASKQAAALLIQSAILQGIQSTLHDSAPHVLHFK
jgi:hypothetical protein